MFEPQYSLSTALLNNLVRIKNLVNELNNQKFPDLVLAKFEKDSYALSAHASTSIEGNPLPLTDVRKILKTKPMHVRDTEKEVLNYNRALEYLSGLLTKSKSVTSEFICTIQSIVLTELIEKKNNGKFRVDPVVVNDPRARKIAYIPPNAEDVGKLMQELVVYLKQNEKAVDPLLLAGIFHKQFVIIHPFIDGNGRTARLVTKYLLARMGLDTFQLFSFENYYNQNVTKYFSHVGVCCDYYEIANTVDFTSWLVYFTDGIVDELLRVQKQLRNSVQSVGISDDDKKILAYIRKHGSMRKSDYAQFTKRAHSTQIQDLKRLVDAGTLVRHSKGKATYYTMKEV